VAEVICPSPFSAVGGLDSNIQIECTPYVGARTVSWNPSDKDPGITLLNGNLTANGDAGDYCAVRANISKSSGKWYWEYRIEGSQVSYHFMGIGTSVENLDQYPGYTDAGYCWKLSSGASQKYHDGNQGYYGDTCSLTDVVGIALDLDNGKIWFSRNGIWQESGNPAIGTNPTFTGILGTFYPMVGLWGNSGSNLATARFIVSDQTYSSPDGFSMLDTGSTDSFVSESNLLSSGLEPLWVDIESQLTAVSSLSATPQPQISANTFTSASSLSAAPMPAVSASAFLATGNFTCDHCFNYAQVEGACPTPICEMAAVFRYARIEAEVPVPSASFRVGKIIEGNLPVPGFTCVAYSGKNPSLVASAPIPICSMRVGLSLSDITTISGKAGVPVPTCNMVTNTHHLATIYGNVPCPVFECNADTANIAIVSASMPCPTGLFETTIGNVASILGRSPCPCCTMVALTGQVVTLSGCVPTPGDLVRFYASLANDNIILAGTVPTPTMTSNVQGLRSSILRHIRGEIR